MDQNVNGTVEQAAEVTKATAEAVQTAAPVVAEAVKQVPKVGTKKGNIIAGLAGAGAGAAVILAAKPAFKFTKFVARKIADVFKKEQPQPQPTPTPQPTPAPQPAPAQEQQTDQK